MEFQFYVNTSENILTFAKQMSAILKEIDKTYNEKHFNEHKWGYTMASTNICIEVSKPNDVGLQFDEEWLQELHDKYQINVNTYIDIDFSNAKTRIMIGEETMFHIVGVILKRYTGDAVLLEELDRPWLLRRNGKIEVYRVYDHIDFSPLELPYIECRTME